MSFFTRMELLATGVRALSIKRIQNNPETTVENVGPAKLAVSVHQNQFLWTLGAQDVQ